MKLPINLPFAKKEKPAFFLALLLRDEKVSAVIFEEFLGKIKIVGEKAEYFPSSIEEASLDDLLDVCDKTISQVENYLSQPLQTIKTVFGLKENWVEDSKIKPEYLAKIKKVSEELELSPIGFLTIHEAVAHLLQKEEGAPVSAILTEIDKKTVTVSLLRGGKIIETKNSVIEESPAKTIDKLLHHFTNYEVLPSRIIIFDGKDTESLSQEFISHSWSKSLPFLHVPQTTPLPKGFDAKAVLFGAATQMGFEVSGSVSARSSVPAQPKNEESKTEEINEEIKETEVANADDFGFYSGKDVANLERNETTKIQENLEELQDTSEIENTPREEIKPKEFVANTNPYPNPRNSGKSFFNKILIPVIFFRKINIWKKLPKFSLPANGKRMFFIPPFAVLFIALIVIFYIFMIKATITVTVSPKTVEKNQEIIFSTKDASDFSKNIVAAESVEVSENGKVSTTATGKKEVGDKAKGTVTIYNKSSDPRTLPSGTLITSSNDLDFSLDSTVTIASASGDFFSLTMGTTKVSVTAAKIGKESNLPSSTTFSIGNLTNIAAKNDTAFSGGNKKEVTVVSKDDLGKLSNDLLKSLEEKAKEDITQKISDEKSLLPSFTNESLSQKSFDKKEGQEASSVTLEGTAAYQGISYKKNDINSFFQNILKENNPDLVFSQDKVKYDVQNLKEKDQEITATINIKAPLLPKIDSSKLVKELSGKSFEESQNFIFKIPQVSNVSIKLNPSLPFIPKVLPKISGNISIKIISQ